MSQSKAANLTLNTHLTSQFRRNSPSDVPEVSISELHDWLLTPDESTLAARLDLSVDRLLRQVTALIGQKARLKLHLHVALDCPDRALLHQSDVSNLMQSLVTIVLSNSSAEALVLNALWNVSIGTLRIRVCSGHLESSLGEASIPLSCPKALPQSPRPQQFVVAMEDSLAQTLVINWVLRAGYELAKPGNPHSDYVINRLGISLNRPIRGQALSPEHLAFEPNCSWDQQLVHINQFILDQIQTDRLRDLSPPIYMVTDFQVDPNRSGLSRRLKQLRVRYQLIELSALLLIDANYVAGKVIFEHAPTSQAMTSLTEWIKRLPFFDCFVVTRTSGPLPNLSDAFTPITLDSITLDWCLLNYRTAPHGQSATRAALLGHSSGYSLISAGEVDSGPTKALSLFNFDQALERAQGNIEDATALFNLFQSSLNEDVDTLTNAIRAANQSIIYQSLHRLRGSLAFTGAERLEHAVSHLFVSDQESLSISETEALQVLSIAEQTLAYIQRREFERAKPAPTVQIQQLQRS